MPYHSGGGKKKKKKSDEDGDEEEEARDYTPEFTATFKDIATCFKKCELRTSIDTVQFAVDDLCVLTRLPKKMKLY